MAGIEGLMLGCYELRRRIAQGGMAEVYLAYDRRVRRQVAIKALYGRDEAFIRRFEREALAVGALTHHNILPLYDFGEQSPWYYLVMPYVPGGTLRDYLTQRHMLTMDEAASIIDQVASALQYAHDQGVVYRDVKPSNILLRPDGYAYLVDFGLAKALTGAISLTNEGPRKRPPGALPAGPGILPCLLAGIAARAIIRTDAASTERPTNPSCPTEVALTRASTPRTTSPTRARPGCPQLRATFYIPASLSRQPANSLWKAPPLARFAHSHLPDGADRCPPARSAGMAGRSCT